MRADPPFWSAILSVAKAALPCLTGCYACSPAGDQPGAPASRAGAGIAVFLGTRMSAPGRHVKGALPGRRCAIGYADL
jgi:hypothetical protein